MAGLTLRRVLSVAALAAFFLSLFAIAPASAVTATTAEIDYGAREGKTYTYGEASHFLVIIYDGPVINNRKAIGGGTVTWRDNGAVVGTTPAWGPYSHFDYTPGAGSHKLVAHYNGDGDFGTAATEAILNFTVTKATPRGAAQGTLAHDKGGSTTDDTGWIGVGLATTSTPTDTLYYGETNKPKMSGTLIVTIDGGKPYVFDLGIAGGSAYVNRPIVYDTEPGGNYVVKASYSGDANNNPLSFTQTVSFDKLYPPEPGSPLGCFVGTCGYNRSVGETINLQANLWWQTTPKPIFEPTGSIVVTNAFGHVVKTASISSFRWEVPFTFTEAGRQCLSATWSGDLHYRAQDSQFLGCWEVAPAAVLSPTTTPTTTTPIANNQFSGATANSYSILRSTGAGATYGTSDSASTNSRQLNAPVIGGAATPGGKGFWSVAGDGGIITAGDAQFYGSTGNMRLNRPVIGMASTPSGKGYWLVAGDGGIFTFGDAGFHGSTGAMKLNAPIIGMTSTPSGNGYWLVAADGGIFTFGDASFFGSTGNMKLNSPVLGMASTPSGRGYWMVAADGGIFTFGDAGFHGSTGASKLNQPVVGMAATPSGNGYWLLGRDGGVFTFGDAPYLGTNIGSANAVAIVSGR